jgi:hypothetical protein
MLRLMPGHTITKAKDRGDTLDNGDLLAAAERAGFDVLVTADETCVINRSFKAVALVVLSTPQWPVVKLHLES